ncbi:MAG: DUF4423 domain-containing protein [Proteobacteria bacterium]|nr:DUF4423 domain-containing protein [Pseudomonadota bacterium]
MAGVGEDTLEKPSRGALSRFSRGAGCQSSYLSQVLNGKAHLSADHVYGIALLLKLGALETDYFFELLNVARATSKKLRIRIEAKLQEIRENAQSLIKLLSREDHALREIDQTFYYSSWVVAATHVCTDVPLLQEPHQIAQYLQIPVDLVLSTLIKLESMGLVIRSGPRWIHSGNQSHVNKTSPLFRSHLQNCWNQAMLDCQLVETGGTHFAGLYAVSDAAYQAMKQVLVADLQQINRIASASESQRIACIYHSIFWLR